MLPKGVKVAYVILMIAAASIAFIALRSHDELATRGNSYTITLRMADEGAGAAQFERSVEQFTRDHHVNVGRLYDDPLDVTARHVYLSVGDPGAESSRWLAEGYPYFSRQANLDFRAYSSAAGTDPSGTYLVYGSKTQAVALLEEFRSLGYQGALEPAVSVGRIVHFFGDGALVTFALVIGLVLTVTVASGTALNAKYYGIQRLQGRSLAEILGRELVAVAWSTLPAGVVLAGLSTLLLQVYNDLHQVKSFAAMTLTIGIGYLLLTLLVHGLTIALLHRSPVLEAVRGKVNARWAITGSYVLRGWGLLLIFSIVTSGIASVWALSQEREKHRVWSSLGEAYYLRISAAVEYADDGAEIGARIGRWLRDADGRGDISVASVQQLPASGREILVVNNRYLADHAVLDAQGRRVEPQADGQVRLLVPGAGPPDMASLRTEIGQWGDLVGGPDRSRKMPDPETVHLRSGQTLVSFTRAAGNGSLERTSPVVLVVPGSSAVISDDEYLTMASNGGLLIRDPAGALLDLGRAGAGDYVLGATAFAAEAADEYREARREFDVQMVNLTAGLAIVLLTAVSVATVYHQRNMQAIFAKHVHGWGFAQIYWRILALEAGLGIALVLWAWSRAAEVIGRSRQPGSPPLPPHAETLAFWGPGIAAVLAGLGLALVVVSLHRIGSRQAGVHTAVRT